MCRNCGYSTCNISTLCETFGLLGVCNCAPVNEESDDQVGASVRTHQCTGKPLSRKGVVIHLNRSVRRGRSKDKVANLMSTCVAK